LFVNIEIIIHIMKKIVFILVLFMLSIYIANAQHDKTKVTVIGNNTFAINLYSKSIKPDSNFVFSPYGISQTMAMIYAGLKGKAANQTANTFRFFYKGDELSKVFLKINNIITENNNVNSNIKILNSIWFQKEYKINNGYLNCINDCYKGNINHVNFKNPIQGIEQIKETIKKEAQKIKQPYNEKLEILFFVG